MKTLFAKYRDFLERAVGRSPNKKEMQEIDKKMKEVNKELKNNGKEDREIERLYDNKLSQIWEKIVAYENNGEEIKLLLNNIEIDKRAKVLSLASGLAIFEMFIAKNIAKHGKVECIDLSNEMNKRAKAIAKKFEISNIHFIKASVKKLLFRDNSQDIVLARRTGLSSGNSWQSILKEVKRVLKDKDSRFIYTVQRDFSKPLVKIKKELSLVGLEFLKIKSFREKDGEIINIIIARKK